MAEQRRDWWAWPAAASLLTVGLAGFTPAMAFAVGLMAVRVVQLAARTGSAVSFPVQVHVTYLAMLILGWWPALAFVHWNLFVGTWLFITTGYCILARSLALLPWNRSAPLTWRVVGRTIFSRPVVNIVEISAPAASPRRGRVAGTGSQNRRGLVATLAQWRRRSQTRSALSGFDERMLRDVGIGYYDARQESRKWFWQR